MKLSKGRKQSGGSIAGDVYFQERGSNRLMVTDVNSGSYLIIRRRAFTKPGGSKKYLLMVTVRASESILKNSDGRLVAACTSVKNIATASGRRKKRSTSTTAAQIGAYDAKATGDPAAASMVTEAQSDFDSASATDNEFSSRSDVLVPMPLVLLVLLASAMSL